jgi:UDP-glucose:(heptosyl)LPS alpha-1,3-glucosyltransferase
MKLAFCIFKYFPYGGVQRDFRCILKACLAKGHDVDVYTMSWEGSRIDGVALNILAPKGMSNHQRAANFANEVEHIVSEKKYAAVAGFNKMWGLDFCFVGDVCFKERIKKEKSFVHRLLPRYRRFLELEEAVFAEDSKTEILLLTPKQIEEYQKNYNTPDKRLHMIPPGIARNNFSDGQMQAMRDDIRSTLKLDDEQFALLFVATDFPNKGLDRAIEALAAVDNANLQLFVVGGDTKENYLQLAAKLKVSDKVQFLGKRSDLFHIMLAMDLLIHPARIEAAGMVLLEAIITGLPILTVAICGYAFHVAQAKAGIVLNSPFVQETFNQALASMVDKDKLKEWRLNAVEYAKTEDLYSMGERAAQVITR